MSGDDRGASGAVPPMPHDRYKVEAFSVGDEGDWIVFGTHDQAEAAALVRPVKHAQECFPQDNPACEDCVWLPGQGDEGWWRQRPGGREDEYAWWLVKATGPGPGVRPAVYFRA